MTPDELRLALIEAKLREHPEAIPARWIAPWPSFKIVGKKVTIILPGNGSLGKQVIACFKVSDIDGIQKFLS